jgi:hypothetical protein
MRFTSLPLVAALTLCSCTAQREVRLTPIPADDNQLVSYPAELRGAYFLTDTTKIRYCAEPAPDVGISSTKNFTVKPPEGAEGNIELSDTALELGGRTALVLLAREMLYRACEASINGGDSTSLADSLYLNAILAIRELGTAAKAESGAKMIAAISSAPEGVFLQTEDDTRDSATRSELISEVVSKIFGEE